MSTFDDCQPLAPSANADGNTSLTQNAGVERVEKASFAAGAKASSSLAWLTENLAALLDSNHYVERNGLPLQRYRIF